MHPLSDGSSYTGKLWMYVCAPPSGEAVATGTGKYQGSVKMAGAEESDAEPDDAATVAEVDAEEEDG